jgi:hypothetical protein
MLLLLLLLTYLCSVYHPCTTKIGTCLCCPELHWNYIDGFVQIPELKENFLPCAIADFFVFVCCNNYEVILARLNLSTLYFKRLHPDVLFFINAFKNKISCCSIFDSVSVRISTRIITDCSTFIVNHNFKVSPSARCVSAANATCKDNDIFNGDCISLTDIL